MDNKLTEYANEQSNSITHESIAPGEILIGEFLGFNAEGEPLVSYSTAKSNMTALSTVAITKEHTGRQVAILFANGDSSKPVIMGLIYSPLMDILNNSENLSNNERLQLESESDNSDVEVFQVEQQTNISHEDKSSDVAYVDGSKVVLEGKEEIVLKCGEASITLTKSGKILIRGKYLLNRSSGVNRISGGSVQVN